MAEKVKGPCYGCTKRHQGCHGTCAEGIAADALHAEEKARRIGRSKAAYDLDEYKHSVKKRIGRRLGNNK